MRVFSLRQVLLAAVLAMGVMVSAPAGATSGWSAEVNLIKTDANVKAAALVGQDGAVWDDEGTGVAAGEAPALVAGVKDASRFQANGIVVAGVKYLYLNQFADGHGVPTFVGRKGATAILVEPTNKAIAIALLKDGVAPASVQKLSFVVNDIRQKGF